MVIIRHFLSFKIFVLNFFGFQGYLKSSTVKELWTPHLSHYGMGWFISNYSVPHNTSHSLKYIHYGGEVAGSVCCLAMIPELDISVALIANLGGLGLEPIALSVINNFVNSL